MIRSSTARICAGIPAINNTLYRRIQFSVGDPTALLELPAENGTRSLLLLRDIEMERARKFANVDQIGCPAEFSRRAVSQVIAKKPRRRRQPSFCVAKESSRWSPIAACR